MTTKDDEDSRLRSVALQNATSILIARQRAEQRQEAYLAEAQRLSHTGSFGWRVATGEIVWSEENLSNLPIRKNHDNRPWKVCFKTCSSGRRGPK